MKGVKVVREFRDFLTEYQFVTLIIAFVMGAATKDLVKSFVDNLLMPLLNPLILDGTWETATLKIGSISFGWGPFMSSALHFTILAVIIFVVVKKLLKKGAKKKPGVPQVQYS